MARKNKSDTQPETTDRVEATEATEATEAVEAVEQADQAETAPSAEHLAECRTRLVNYLAGAVSELRDREAGREPEMDLVKLGNEVEPLARYVETKQLWSAVDETLRDNPTSAAVLDAMYESDKAEVLALVEALGDQEGNGQSAMGNGEEAQPEAADGPAAEAGSQPAASRTAQAYARLCEIVAEGAEVEAADKKARELADEANKVRTRVREVIKTASKELGDAEHAARSARSQYVKKSLADRSRVGRLNKQVRELAEAVREAEANGQAVSENVRRVLAASAKGEPITTELV